MKNIKFSDWQELGLKKDIENIDRHIKKKPIIGVLAIIELIIATCAVSLAALTLIDNDVAYKGWLIALLIMAISAPALSVLIYLFLRNRKLVSLITRNKMDVRSYTNSFDNKVCNYALMASSLVEDIKEHTELSIELKYFALSEVAYFINKCIDELYLMSTLVGEIFDAQSTNKIQPNRLYMVIKLMASLRVDIKKQISVIKETNRDKTTEEYIERVNEEHDRKLQSFLGSFRGINKDKRINIDPEWVDYSKLK